MMHITFFTTVTLLIFLVFTLSEERKQRVQKRLVHFLDAPEDALKNHEQNKASSPFAKRMFTVAWDELKRIFNKKISEEKEIEIEQKLQQAGNPFGMTTLDFRLLQMACILLIPILFVLYGRVLRLGIVGIVLLLLLGITAALLLPHFYLSQKKKQRSKKGLQELPDVVDLLTVSLEAGLGFDAALSKLISKKTGILANELHRSLEEIRLGKTRREALKGVTERLVIDELNVLINSILQAEKLGISMVQILRIQSHEIRQKRKQRAEETAMKAPIKMLFPLVLFIFPSLFIVLLGPALIQFLTTFAK